MPIRFMIGAVMALTLTRCAPEPEPESPIVAPCLASCGKLSCTADVEANCSEYCEDASIRAEDLGDPCPRDLQALFECQESLDCFDYVDWYHEVPGAPCLDEEASVQTSCPGIELR